MNEIALTIVIALLIAFNAFHLWITRKERDKFINALIAKNARELQDIEFTEKVKTEPQKEKPPDLIPESEAPEDEWMKAIEKEIA